MTTDRAPVDLKKEFELIISSMQKTLIAPKGDFNSHGKYKYRNLESLLAAIKLVMPVGGYINLSDKLVKLGDRFYIKATATFTYGLISISSTAYAREETERKGMDASQISGKTGSYARKYALSGLFICDDNPSAEALSNSAANGIEKAQATQPTEQPKITTDQSTYIQDLMKEVGFQDEKINNHFKIKDWRECPQSVAVRIIKALENKRDSQ